MKRWFCSFKYYSQSCLTRNRLSKIKGEIVERVLLEGSRDYLKPLSISDRLRHLPSWMEYICEHSRRKCVHIDWEESLRLYNFYWFFFESYGHRKSIYFVDHSLIFFRYISEWCIRRTILPIVVSLFHFFRFCFGWKNNNDIPWNISCNLSKLTHQKKIYSTEEVSLPPYVEIWLTLFLPVRWSCWKRGVYELSVLFFQVRHRKG